MTMMSRVAKRAVVLLLGLVLVGHGFFPTSAAGGSPETKSACCCTGCDQTDCATPSCCVSPAGNRAPISPAPAPARTQNETQALAASASLLILPSIPVEDFAVSVSSFGHVAAVPIFQRDCSYLI